MNITFHRELRMCDWVAESARFAVCAATIALTLYTNNLWLKHFILISNQCVSFLSGVCGSNTTRPRDTGMLIDPGARYR